MPLFRFEMDMLKEMAFYGEYHADWRNQLIHIFFVPCLVWSGMVFLVHTGPLTTIPMVSDTVEVNGAFVAALLYMSYYLYLDFWPALGVNAMFAVLLSLANAFVDTYGSKAWQYALALHVFSWWAQIHPGHKIFEGRKPALMDSFFQSLVLAPFFVYMEVAFYLGFRKEFHKKLVNEVGRRRVKWRASLRAAGKAKDT